MPTPSSDGKRPTPRKSGFCYPPPYKGLMPLEKQIDFFVRLFNLDVTPILEWMETVLRPRLKLSLEADNWVAVPRFQSIRPIYTEAVAEVFSILVHGKRFTPCRDKFFIPARLRRSHRTTLMRRILSDSQKGCLISVMPIQLGRLHPGESPELATKRFLKNEFGLTLFDVICILLAHPQLFEHESHFGIYCLGDEGRDLTSGTDFNLTPQFLFARGSGDLEFELPGSKFPYCGSATAFLLV